MSFTGNWKRTGATNGIEVMKHIGMPDEAIEFAKTAEVFIETKHEGNTMHEVYKLGPKETVTTFEMGKETELTQWNGEKVKAVPKSVGDNKYQTVFDFKGIHYIVSRELISSTEFIDTVDLDNGKVVGTYTYTKC